MEKKFKSLAEPIRIGSLTVRNRVWMAPMWTRLASVDGECTQLLEDHYVARAKGGAGLIAQEATAVDGRHRWIEPQVRIDEDRFAPSLHRLVDAVHTYDVPIICQLHHAGMFGTDPVSPSGVPAYDWGAQHYLEPRVLTTEEVDEIAQLWIQAAVRAKKIEYDGVGLHGGTGYLLEQFFSPHNNKRTDKYGGSLEGRMLLALEIVRGIRRLCGPDFVITYTLTDDDFVPGGIDPEDSVAFAKALEREGITFLDIKINGTYETFHLEEAPGHLRRQKKGQFDLTEKYKKELGIPVGTSACGEYDPAVNDDAIRRGIVDMVLFGRQTLADPAYFDKVLEGRAEDVRPCIRCIDCMFNGVAKIWNVSCSVNTGVGRGERPVERAPAAKKVLVIGGGPGGLEASRVAALRGHDVTLVEKKATLGGNMAIASLPIAKEVFMSFIEWAERECKKLGVKIEVNKEVSAEEVQERNPDAVIVATGSRPLIPPLPGADKSHVVTAEDVLAGKAAVGEKVVVAGGDIVGIETADFIVEKGLAKDVTVVEMLPEILRSENPLDRAHWFAAVLPKIGLKIFTNTRVEEITDECVIAIDKDWKKHRFEADTVVLAVGYNANRTLYDALRDKVENLCLIGDAKAVRKVENAVHEAFLLAQQI